MTEVRKVVCCAGDCIFNKNSECNALKTLVLNDQGECLIRG